jgi:hypothetical protein
MMHGTMNVKINYSHVNHIKFGNEEELQRLYQFGTALLRGEEMKSRLHSGKHYYGPKYFFFPFGFQYKFKI